MRAPSLRRTWWKLTSRSSVAAYSLTPILTSPKDTLPFQIERTAPPGRRPNAHATAAPRRYAAVLLTLDKNGRMEPMLATSVSTLPVSDGWAYEFKWDGVRTLLDV